MSNQEIRAELKNKFLLVFITEFWSDNPLYELWTEGRIEISKWDNENENDEIHYCTKKTTEWFEFQEKYNGEWLTANELVEFKKILKKKFSQKQD